LDCSQKRKRSSWRKRRRLGGEADNRGVRAGRKIQGRGRKRVVWSFLVRIQADVKLCPEGRHGLELRRLRKVLAGRAVGVDDAFRQQIFHRVPALWNIGRKEVVKSPILANQYDDVLDGSASSSLLLRLNRASKRAAQSKLEYGHGHETDAQTVHG